MWSACLFCGQDFNPPNMKYFSCGPQVRHRSNVFWSLRDDNHPHRNCLLTAKRVSALIKTKTQSNLFVPFCLFNFVRPLQTLSFFFPGDIDFTKFRDAPGNPVVRLFWPMLGSFVGFGAMFIHKYVEPKLMLY